MIDRQKRLHEVYEYLRENFPIHTQSDFAEALKYSRVYISAAMNGTEKNLTDKLFKSICEAYPGVFDLNYLLTGEGNLLTVDEEVFVDEMKKATTPSTDEMTANILELYARMIRGVDDLRIQLKEELAEVQSVKSELQQARDDFRDATYRLTQELSRINNSSTTHIGIAADDGGI
jgi:transcriptional regulator with XRE-family HTH domain